MKNPLKESQRFQENDYEEDTLITPPQQMGQAVPATQEPSDQVPTVQKPVSEPTVNSETTSEFMDQDMQQFCLHALRMYLNVHLWHLTTSSYAQHKALETYYEELVELSDTLTECTSGVYGRINATLGFEIELVPLTLMFNEIEAFKNCMYQMRELVYEDSIHKVLDDIFASTDQCLYRLKNLD